MPRKKSTIFYLFFIFVPLIMAAFAACDDTICSNLYSTTVNVSFYDKQSRALKLTKFDTVTSSGTDTLFYVNDSLSTYLLPVNTFTDSTLFLFIRNGKTDSLLVRYRRTMNLISKQCGFSQVFVQVEAPYSTFPEVISNKNTLDITHDINIQVYY